MGLVSFVAVLLLAASSCAINIPPVPNWPSGRCTDKSLSIPSWVLSQYKVSAGVTTFVVNNRATNPTGLTASVTCSPGKTECQSSAGGDGMRASLTSGPNGPVVEIFEFWSCSDEGDHVTFTAKGNTTITSCPGSDCTSPITYLVPGTLTLPVPLTPSQPKPPKGFDSSSCAQVGEKQWIVSGVEYKNYTKSQCKQWYIEESLCFDNGFSSFISKGQYLKLNVTNNVISHEVLCSFTPTYGNSNIPQPLRCVGGNFNEITLDVTWIGSAPDFQVKVEELWYCLENPTINVNPSVITAVGSTSLPLKCESHTGVTGTADDIVTICIDPATSHTVDAVQNTKDSLPPFSLVTAYPVHGGCTFDSVVNPTFFYRSMFFETKPDLTLSRFSAGLTGPGFADYFFYENVAIKGTNQDTVYTCAVYYDGKPREQHYKCTYSFDATTKTITQNKVWECKDKNAATPLYFEGSGEFNWGVDPYSQCSGGGEGSGISCYWHDSQSQLQPGIAFGIPKVTVSTVNVLPPDYGQPSVKSVADAPIKALRVDGQWKLAE